MGKDWDRSGVAFHTEMWQELCRVLKPRAHILVFGGTRTYHRIACAVEDAGFECKNMLVWLYGSGFPKSLNIEKEVIKRDIPETGNRYKGYGTGLKPAFEPLLCATKPLYAVASMCYISDKICQLELNVKDVEKHLKSNRVEQKEAMYDSVQWNAGEKHNISEGSNEVMDTSRLDAKTVSTALSTILLWKRVLEEISKKKNKSIISTESEMTTNLKILSWLIGQLTYQNIIQVKEFSVSGKPLSAIIVEKLLKEENLTLKNIKNIIVQEIAFSPQNKGSSNVLNAEKNLLSISQIVSIVLLNVLIAPITENEKEELHIFVRYVEKNLKQLLVENLNIVVESAWQKHLQNLKPNMSSILLARKPISERNIASNVLKWSCGGLAINKSRIVNGKTDTFFYRGNKIRACVENITDDNNVNKDYVHREVRIHHNFDKLYSFLVAAPLVSNEKTNVLNQSILKDYLGDCPLCLHLCDALAHALSICDLISPQRLNDVHRYIHQTTHQDVLPCEQLYTHLFVDNDHLSNEDSFPVLKDQSSHSICSDDLLYASQEYLKSFHNCNHTCVQDKSILCLPPLDIPCISSFLSQHQTGNLDGFSFCSQYIYVVPLIKSFLWERVEQHIKSNSRFPSNLILECCCEEDELVEGKVGEPKIIQHLSGIERINMESGNFKPVNSINYNDNAAIHTNLNCVCRMLDEQSGVLDSGGPARQPEHDYARSRKESDLFDFGEGSTLHGYSGKGGASRFFYQAKASQNERWFYCTICKQAYPMKERDKHVHDAPESEKYKHLEFHPTQKPLELIQYLVRLITPPNGTVLDPFMGTGTTLVAAEQEGFNSIGVDSKLEYCKITEKRLSDATRQGKIDREPSVIEKIAF